MDFDNGEQYVLSLKPVLRGAPTFFESKQVQFARSSNTFTAQEAEFYSNANLTKFWNRAFLTKYSDTTLKLLGKAISYDFLTSSENHSIVFFSSSHGNRFNPMNVSRVALGDHFLNIAPLFAADWFALAFFCIIWLCMLFLISRWNLFFHLSVSVSYFYVPTEISYACIN